MIPTARVQRGPSEAARCASKGIVPSTPSPFFSILLMSGCRTGRFRLLAVSAWAVVFRIFRRGRRPVLLAEKVRDKHGFEMGREVIEFHGECFRLGRQKVVAKER